VSYAIRFAILAVTICTAASLSAQNDWLQWAQNAQHTGFLNVVGQAPNRILANIVYDPLVPQEQAANSGELLAHYQVPLVHGNDVYMEFKSGNYNKNTYKSQIWGERKFQWASGQLVQQWSFTSDWAPPGSQFDFWEPVFHAVLSGSFVYVPGAHGTLIKVNTADGTMAARIDPFAGGDVDNTIYTAGPPTMDPAGNLFYNAIRINGSDFFKHDAIDSWLVKVFPDGSTKKVSYTILNPSAPKATDSCLATFTNDTLPWPPSPDAVPGSITCGLQRVALNIAPAIAPDGTIYSITRAHFISRFSYLVAVNPDLTLKWAASLRDRFHDGCRATAAEPGIMPLNGTPGGCRVGANAGVDPAINRPGGGRVLDDSSSTPVIAPDGSIFYGSYTSYNYLQGQLMHFDSNGNFLNNYGFGWDSTPAIWAHSGTYSVIIKDNHYGDTGSYCDVEAFCPSDRSTNSFSPEQYFLTQLSPTLAVEWKFQNTNTQSCTRNADGSVSCVSDHPLGFEWCVNAPVLDANGNVYANSEDGNLYVIAQGSTLRSILFQNLALGAAYTPTSLGADGKIYSQNDGHLFVAGQ
jgi:hypothetical protein